MGNLRDALRKAKVISEKEARRLAHEERVHRQQAGGSRGLDREEAERQLELAGMQANERERDRQRQAQIEAGRQEAAELSACRQILTQEAQKPRGQGGEAFYFRTGDGQLPCLSLSQAERLDLQAGRTCVVRLGPGAAHVYGLLACGHAKRLALSLPDRIAWAHEGALD